ncbi:MAG TPA: zinc-dependent metalloprotease [Opitutaceae bacterium]
MPPKPATATPAPAKEKPEAAITEKTREMKALPGFFPLYWDEAKGELWLEIPRLEEDFIYFTSLPGGLGSNDVGLDRGQLGQERLVRFTRSGNKVLLVQRNLAFRATSPDEREQRAVEDAFATSVLAGFTIAAEEGGRLLVNATDFAMRDAHDVAGRLKQTRQGTFTLDPKRSALFLPRTRSFPRNTEIESMLTFAGTEPGEWVQDVTPDPKSVTVRLRQSFVQLPEPGYVPRVFDPRAGYFPMRYADYGVPIAESVERRFITRHRLEKKNPLAARSEVVKPIVYYLDPGTPEPIRSALLEGARWWSEAFEAAGFLNAFRVELLPPDGDMQDVRYNTIQWVHRATRGWSYGSSIIDPRTGEILKGHVTLGSLRVRQDYLIAEGLLAPYEDGKPASPEMEKMALARLRQLAAHEIGHTLGLAHNFLASVNGRASVMDYPHPLARLRTNQTIDLTEAYATGIGDWDKIAITAGYAQFAAGADEAAEIDRILREGRERGLSFLTDQDARPPGGAHPQAHLWDNGTDAVEELNRMLEVRSAALASFGANVIRPGRPLATIEEALVPLYLSHRYQVEAVAKAIAGQSYSFALRGDGQVPLAPVPVPEQDEALQALLAALAPKVLRLPEPLLAVLPPRPPGYPATRELFTRRTGLVFDALAPAEAAASLTFALVFHPERANRLVQQHARDPRFPGLEEVITRVLAATWRRPAAEDFEGEIQRVVNAAALDELLRLGASRKSGPQVQAIVARQLELLRDWLATAATTDTVEVQRAHLAQGHRLIGRFLEKPDEFAPPPAPAVPPGQPIGSAQCDFEYGAGSGW